MRNVLVQFPSGREVLSSYWGFLKNGGLVIKEPKDLNEGDPIVLDVRIKSLKQSYRFAGHVVKRIPNEQRMFVAFNEGQDQQIMLNAAWADSNDVPQRKHRRYAGGGEVRYTPSADPSREIRGHVLDVSPGGCRLRGPRALPVSTRVRVTAIGIVLEGHVRWSTAGNEMGIEFNKPELVVQAFLDNKLS